MRALGEELPGTSVAVSLSLSSHWFLQPEVLRTSLPRTGTLGLGPGVGLRPSLLRGDFCSRDVPPDLYLPLMGVGPARSVSLPLLSVLMWLLL